MLRAASNALWSVTVVTFSTVHLILLIIIFTLCRATDSSDVTRFADKLIISKMDVVVVGSCMTDLVRCVPKTMKNTGGGWWGGGGGRK